MTKEDIEKASIHAIRKHYGCAGKHPCYDLENCRFCSGKNSAYDCNECGADEFNEGFIIGANWRINSVWHEAKEKPKRSGMILAVTNDGTPIICGPDICDWSSTVKIFEIFKWAYMEDLLPNKEDTK